MIGVESVVIALQGLLANRLRSALTVLGMLIGVASVIVLIAVGNGSQAAVQSRIEALGTNVLLVMPPRGIGGPGIERVAGPVADARPTRRPSRTRSTRPTSRAPRRSSTRARRSRSTGRRYSPSSFLGATPTIFAARTYKPAAGAFFTTADVTSHNRVVVLGETVVVQPLRRREPDRPDRPDRRRQLHRGRRHPAEGLERHAGPGRRRDRADHGGRGLADRVRPDLARSSSRRSREGALNAASAEVTGILDGLHHITATSTSSFTVINQGSLLADVQRDERRLHDAARRGRRDLAAGRRDRRDEHHARDGHRANPRDRDPQGDRRAQDGHPLAVPDRGRARLGARRPGRGDRRPRDDAVPDRRRPSRCRRPGRSASPSARRWSSDSSSGPIPPAGPRRCARSTRSATNENRTSGGTRNGCDRSSNSRPTTRGTESCSSTRPRRRLLSPPTVILAIVLFAVVGFFVGVKVEKGQVSPRAARPRPAAPRGGARRSGARGRTAREARRARARGAAWIRGGVGGAAGAAGAAGGPVTTGTVESTSGHDALRPDTRPATRSLSTRLSRPRSRGPSTPHRVRSTPARPSSCRGRPGPAARSPRSRSARMRPPRPPSADSAAREPIRDWLAISVRSRRRRRRSCPPRPTPVGGPCDISGRTPAPVAQPDRAPAF